MPPPLLVIFLSDYPYINYKVPESLLAPKLVTWVMSWPFFIVLTRWADSWKHVHKRVKKAWQDCIMSSNVPIWANSYWYFCPNHTRVCENLMQCSWLYYFHRRWGLNWWKVQLLKLFLGVQSGWWTKYSINKYWHIVIIWLLYFLFLFLVWSSKVW